MDGIDEFLGWLRQRPPLPAHANNVAARNVPLAAFPRQKTEAAGRLWRKVATPALARSHRESGASVLF
jgi:hypothetical protein